MCMLYLQSVICCIVFFFKQKTAYEMRISDWSSDVCSSDLSCSTLTRSSVLVLRSSASSSASSLISDSSCVSASSLPVSAMDRKNCAIMKTMRSEEHTSELQSLMRISYAVFCLQKKKQTTHNTSIINQIVHIIHITTC